MVAMLDNMLQFRISWRCDREHRCKLKLVCAYIADIADDRKETYITFWCMDKETTKNWKEERR